MLQGTLLLDRGYTLIPWVSGGLGLGFNRAYSFNNIPVISEAIVNPNFANHTKKALTYALSAGLEKRLSSNLQVGIGYQFADWGKSTLGQSLDQTTNNVLTLDHLYTNGLILNVTYLRCEPWRAEGAGE